MSERTGESRWHEAARESATALRARRGEDGLWRQDDDYRGLSTLHGVAGNTLALLRFEPDAAVASESAAVLSRHAFREDGLANWPGSPRPQLARPRDGRICLQWCTGAPGVVAGAWEYLDEELLLAGAELIWRAGAHGDEKGHGLCHGTSGNGFALLKTFARTGDERWLERARRFAVHALAQAERIAAANGRRRYSLFNGDVGTALFAAACLAADHALPYRRRHVEPASNRDPLTGGLKMHDRDVRQSLSDGRRDHGSMARLRRLLDKRHVLTVSIDSARFTMASCEPL